MSEPMNDSTTAETGIENRSQADTCAALTGSEPSRQRWRESVKAIAPRAHVVQSKPSRASTGREPRIENLAPEEWRPRHVCAMSMDFALREMEFPSRLAGASWVLE